MTDATEIMEQLAKKYAGCQTYSDSGYVFKWGEGDEKGDEPELTFKTFFARPSKFRFEWQEGDNFNIIWCDGIQSYSLYHWDKKQENRESLSRAIAGATGVSSGAAHAVPALLISRVRATSNHLLRLKDCQVKGSDTLDGIDCHLIVGSAQRNSDTIILVSKTDFSLRRIREFSVITIEELAEMKKEAETLGFGAELDEWEFEERQYFTELSYECVAFDEEIADASFSYKR
jgi:hypothetical protein